VNPRVAVTAVFFVNGALFLVGVANSALDLAMNAQAEPARRRGSTAAVHGR
jgi:hypothetical protein